MSGYAVTDPATGRVVEEFGTITDEALEDALATSAAGQAKWASRGFAERAEIVGRVAALFAEKADELAEIIGVEMGKRTSEGVEEAEFSRDIFGYYADHAEQLCSDLPLDANPGGAAVVERRPIGVILGIMPWNFPYYQVARFAAPNLMLGNAVIVKHAQICPRSSAAIAAIMTEAGVPDGVYTNVYASHDQIETLIADPRIAGVSLTGSERAGRQVAAQAGANLKKAVLELGGSDPYIVLDTDDVAGAAQQAWETRMYNVGQVCNANKRLIVAADIYDEFVAELEKLAAAATPGDHTATDPTVYTPMSSRGGRRDPGGAAGGSCRCGCEPAGRRPAGRDRGLRLPRRAHRHPGGLRGVLPGALRAGGLRVQGVLGRRGRGTGQQHPVRPGRLGVVHRPGAGQEGGCAAAGRHGAGQQRRR